MPPLQWGFQLKSMSACVKKQSPIVLTVSHTIIYYISFVRMDLALEHICPVSPVILTFHFSCRCQVLSNETVKIMQGSFWYWFYEINQILLRLPDYSVLFSNRGQCRDYYTICQCKRLLSLPFDLRLLFNYIGLERSVLLFVNVDTMIYNQPLLQACYNFVSTQGLLRAENILSVIGNHLRIQNLTGLHISTYPVF